jgi:hypothetical protein
LGSGTAVHLPLPAVVGGFALGILLSLPDAIITEAFVPIATVGAVGGLLIAWLGSHVVHAV